MNDYEKIELLKAIEEIQNAIKFYDRQNAIDLIIRIRRDHPGKEQVVYVFNNVPLEQADDKMIIDTLVAEKNRLICKLNEE